MPYLAHITIYPIKSLDGVGVSEATLLKGGALAGDREFALFDALGAVVNAKRTADIHRIRSRFDLAARTVTLTVPPSDIESTFHLDGDRSALEQWLSDFFHQPITLRQNLHMGFPDDEAASGPTLVSTATLETVAAWFNMDLEEARRRFRANLEIAEAAPFWEDHLFGEADRLCPFHVGAVTLFGSHPCQRCIVPTRDSQTGDRTPHFQTQFATQRQATLPPWANSSRFNHFYKLTVNTQMPSTEAGKILRRGDQISLGHE